MQMQQAQSLEDQVGQQHQLHQQQLDQMEEEAAEQRQMAEEAATQQLLYQERQYHNTTPNSMHSSNSMRVQSPLIISHQQYQEQLQQQQQQQMADFTLPHTPPPPQLQPVLMQQHMDQQQQYNIIPLDINTQQHNNNMLLQQLPLQPHIINNNITTLTTNHMDSIHTMQPQLLPPLHHTVQQLQEEVERNTPQPQQQVSTHMLDMHNMHTRTPTPPITQQLLPPLLPLQQQHITNIPSYHQQQQGLAVGLPPLEHTMTYHTIIGNNSTLNSNGSELLQLSSMDAYGNMQLPQTLTTSDGQILQFITAPSQISAGATQFYTTLPRNEAYAPLSPYAAAHRSPQEADLPPAQSFSADSIKQETSQTLTVLPAMPFSPTISSSTYTHMDDYGGQTINQHTQQAMQETNLSNVADACGQMLPDSSPMTAVPAKKRKAPALSAGTSKRRKGLPVISSMSPSTATLPTGRIKCLECNKEFTKICYLTQHNKSFHSGEYPFRCQTCGKRFQSEDVYTIHLGRHKSQDKPHKCEMCPKQFHHKTDLRRHVEGIHTGNKQHVCDLCEKSFCRKDHLRKHMETHSKPRVLGKKAQAKAQNMAESKPLNNKIMNAFVSATGEDTPNMQAPTLTPKRQLKIHQIFQSSGHNNSQIALDSVIDDVAADDDSLVDDEADEVDSYNVHQQQQQEQQIYETIMM